VTITVEINTDVEAELAAQADARGMDVPAYAAALLEQAARRAGQQRPKQTLSEFLMESPLAGSEIYLERDKDTGRTIEL
jgi:hypothetical protein